MPQLIFESDLEYCRRLQLVSQNEQRERAQKRSRAIKEELMVVCWNPDTKRGQWLVLNEIGESEEI
jgi:hypothetical protein